MGSGNVLIFILALGFFLFGMKLMSEALEQSSGDKLKYILGKLTNQKGAGVLLGVGITAIIQSSSATTVMVVGLVNAGVMRLGQSVGVIMGANIGTTVTSWVLSMAGISGGKPHLDLCFAGMAVLGMVLLICGRQEKSRCMGKVLLGLGMLLLSMEVMTGCVSPLAKIPSFQKMMVRFSNPVLGMLMGTVLTAVIQSSSASVGILQALCATGTVPFAVAIPVIMGQNIGTCVTAMIAGLGGNSNAKRAALIHLYFNLLGTGIFLLCFCIGKVMIPVWWMNQPVGAVHIALIHSIFNVAATVLLYPFSELLVRMAIRTVPEESVSYTSKK